MEGIIFTVNPFGEKHYILVLRTKDNSVPHEGLEILCRSQTGCHSIRANRHISNVVCVVDKGNPGVFDTKAFIFVCGAKCKRIFNFKVDAIGTACQP